MTSENVTRRTLEGKEIIIIGTAHVSQESADLAGRVIEEERPDTVCVELCQSRYEAIRQKDTWESTDIVHIIKKKQTSLLLSQLLMASVQKKLADKFGIKPGEEMLRAIEKAEATGASLVLADRDIKTTLTRTWRKINIFSKLKIILEMVLSLVFDPSISEEEIEDMKKQDMLEIALTSFGKKLPQVKTILVDERDQYLARSITNARGPKIVAVVGAGHVPGILRHLGYPIDIEPLNEIPPKKPLGKIIAWGLSALVIAIIVTGFIQGGMKASMGMLKWWVLINGILAGFGALAVLAHPATIAASIIAAPFTSLNPMVAAGWVAGLTEAALRKPQVKDFISLRDDITTIRGFWRNKIARILLVVVFVNLGSSLGTFIAIPLMMKYLVPIP
ncbi:MAG: TraB/GumN family protein [Syntrophales bacterium]|jgi:pheromone shutdown-related protein TraB|nr:TraB/GumN family protein [Syntrophales bacterium]MCK9528757.1 TraB/GumN family protein [Syntrophales bacterium]MDX9922503.1 TraB/GumN family protein [Syntrophales bacterium]